MTNVKWPYSQGYPPRGTPNINPKPHSTIFITGEERSNSDIVVLTTAQGRVNVYTCQPCGAKLINAGSIVYPLWHAIDENGLALAGGALCEAFVNLEAEWAASIAAEETQARETRRIEARKIVDRDLAEVRDSAAAPWVVRAWTSALVGLFGEEDRHEQVEITGKILHEASFRLRVLTSMLDDARNGLARPVSSAQDKVVAKFRQYSFPPLSPGWSRMIDRFMAAYNRD